MRKEKKRKEKTLHRQASSREPQDLDAARGCCPKTTAQWGVTSSSDQWGSALGETRQAACSGESIRCREWDLYVCILSNWQLATRCRCRSRAVRVWHTSQVRAGSLVCIEMYSLSSSMLCLLGLLCLLCMLRMLCLGVTIHQGSCNWCGGAVGWGSLLRGTAGVLGICWGWLQLVVLSHTPLSSAVRVLLSDWLECLQEVQTHFSLWQGLICC